MEAPQFSATNRLPEDYQERRRILMAGFLGQIEPVKISLGYRLAILIVTFVMILLPLIYLGMIGLVAYCVYWHSVHNLVIFEGVQGRGVIFLALIYAAPLIVGFFLILFMLKPIFANSGPEGEKQTLQESDEPLLFEFVHRICQAVRAPIPKQIDVDCEVNASASFRRGIWSMLTGGDLTLTLGTPLISGLNTRELAGVLAHEFGHFSQGAGMRLTYVIRTISYWLTRAVYERDEWDVRLVDWSQSFDIRIGWVFYVTRGMVWLTRKLLWCLMTIGMAVSGYMLRHMEFDADRHEARMAGSKTFELTSQKMAILGFANHNAHEDLSDFYREGRLGDDLAKLITTNANRFDATVLTKIQKLTDEQKTGAFDTHPCNRDRIANAYQENAPGVFQLEFDSRGLFRDFDQLSRRVTFQYLNQMFDRRLQQEQLHDVDVLLERQKEELSAYEALQRFFQGAFEASRSIELPTANDQPASQQTLDEVKSIRLETPHFFDQSRSAVKQLEKADDRMFQVRQAEGLIEHNFVINAKSFDEPLHTSAKIEQAKLEIAQWRAQADAVLTPLEAQVVHRITSSLSLLNHLKIAARIDSADSMKAEVARLLPIYRDVNRLNEEVADVQHQTVLLNVVLQSIPESGLDQETYDQVMRVIRKCLVKSMSLRGELDKHAYPFDHAKPDIGIGSVAVERPPSSQNPGDVLQAGSELSGFVPRIKARVLGRLCWIAERVEEACGMEPLNDPPSRDE